MPSFSMAWQSRRTERTMTAVLLALMDTTTSMKCSFWQMRRNSMQLSTMPPGVSP